MTASTFELDYELTPEDLNAWKIYWFANLVQRSRALNLLAVILGAISGLAIVGIYCVVAWGAGVEWDPLMYGLYFYSALGGAVVTVVVFRRQRTPFRRKLRARLSRLLREWDEQLLGRRTLTTSADGFKLDSPVGSTSRKWNIVSRVHVTDSHVFIMADVTVIVPRNAFSTDTECEKFVEAAENWRQQP